MKWVLTPLVVLGLLLSPLPTWAQDEDEGPPCPGRVDTPEETASVLFSEFLANGQWDEAYAVLHPEAQLRVPRQIFSGARQARAITEPVLDVEVFPARIAPARTWGVTGVRFTDVAEVPVRFVRARGFNAVPVLEMVPLVRVGPCWRWLPPVLP